MDTVKLLTKVFMPTLCVLLAVALATPASADVTYTYTGEAFTSGILAGTGTPDYISGSITLASAIPASTTGVLIEPYPH